MRYSSSVKPISHFKANAAEFLEHLALGNRDAAVDKVKLVADVVARRRAKRAAG